MLVIISLLFRFVLYVVLIHWLRFGALGGVFWVVVLILLLDVDLDRCG